MTWKGMFGQRGEASLYYVFPEWCKEALPTCLYFIQHNILQGMEQQNHFQHILLLVIEHRKWNKFHLEPGWIWNTQFVIAFPHNNKHSADWMFQTNNILKSEVNVIYGLFTSFLPLFSLEVKSNEMKNDFIIDKVKILITLNQYKM